MFSSAMTDQSNNQIAILEIARSISPGLDWKAKIPEFKVCAVKINRG